MSYDNWLDKQYHDHHDEDWHGYTVEVACPDTFDVWSPRGLEAEGFETSDDAWEYIDSIVGGE
tara:strand:- start:277 stop:465 length:189 start_codon:yes stop_codon:yes gene_type:complete